MRIRNERGGSLIEFAIIAPLLFVIVFGIIEFGIMLYDKAVITNASREGARAGIVYDTALRNADLTVNQGAVTTTVSQVVTNYCAGNLISFKAGDAITVVASFSANPETGTVTSGGSLTVTVDYPFHFLIFSNVIALVGGGGSMANLTDLRAETVMRFE